MSGLGGNLTYPSNKQFVNSFSIIDPSDPWGVAGTNDIRLITDLQVQEGVTGAKTLFFEKTGDYIPGGAQASVTRVNYKDSISKVDKVVLEDRGPIDESTHELGFIVEAIAQHPGVFNDNKYGQRRTYAHKFDYLDPVVSGVISDLDIMRAYSDINQQITNDTGRYSGGLQGNVESVVDSFTTLDFSATIAGATFDIPAAGVYGAALTAVTDYIDTPLAVTTGVTVGNSIIGESYLVVTNATHPTIYVGQSVTVATTTPAAAHTVTKIVKGATTSKVFFDTVWTNADAGTLTYSLDVSLVNNSSIAVTYPGYGFIVHPAGAETIATHEMILSTKDTFKDLTTFNVEKFDGVVTNLETGNFELLPWAEVFREFSHMAHDVPLSNMHDVDKPSSTYPWTKFILNTNHRNAAIHGASHHGSYLEEIILFVPDNGAASGAAGCVDDLEDLFDVWAS